MAKEYNSPGGKKVPNIKNPPEKTGKDSINFWNLKFRPQFIPKIRFQELHTLRGYSGYIYSVAISPDGRFIVSGSGDGTLKLWELATGKLMFTLKGHSWLKWVRSVAITPDGRYIVSGSNDKTLKVWALATGKELRILKGHSNDVRSVAISSDGRYIVSGSEDKTLKVWEFATNKLLRTLEGHSLAVYSVAISPDGRYVVSGSFDDTLKVWELATGKLLRTFKGHSLAVYSVAISPDGRYIVSGSCDKTLKVWELLTGKLLHTFKGHSQEVRSVAISPDGRYIVSGSGDGTLKVWELATEIVLFTLKGHSSEVYSVAISPDGCYIVSGSDDETIKVWKLTGYSKDEEDELKFEILLQAAKELTEKGNKEIRNELYQDAIESWNLSINKQNLALEKALSKEDEVKIQENIKNVKESICSAYQHSGIQHDNNAKTAYDKNDFQSAETEWNAAKSDFKTAIELIKIEKFNISIELLELKSKMFDLNLKQLEIEKACLEADKDVEKAKKMDETQVIEAIKIVLDSQEKYSRAIIETSKTHEFAEFQKKIRGKLENAKQVQSSLEEKKDNLMKISPIAPKVVISDMEQGIHEQETSNESRKQLKAPGLVLSEKILDFRMSVLHNKCPFCDAHLSSELVQKYKDGESITCKYCDELIQND